MSPQLMNLKRGGARKEWVHLSYDPAGRCIYCGNLINTTNTSVKKNHLINPRACRYYLWTADAARNPDDEVQAVIASLASAPDKESQERFKRIQGVVEAEALIQSLAPQCSRIQHENALKRDQDIWFSQSCQYSGLQQLEPCHMASSDKSPKASYDLLPEQLGSRKKRPGHPRFKSQSDGYLQSDIAKVEAIVKQLKAAQDILSEDNMRKQALIDVYGRGICSADTHLSYLLISQCAFSRETRNVLMLEEANQAALSALPPPDQWDERVLGYFNGMGADHYRALLHHSALQIKGFLLECIKFGSHHPSYQKMLSSVSKIQSAGTYILRVHPSVVMANMNCDLSTGDRSSPPDSSWWTEVAYSIPVELILDQRDYKGFVQAIQLYLRRARIIQEEQRILSKALSDLIGPDNYNLRGNLPSQYQAKASLDDGCYALYNNHDMEKLDCVLEQLKATYTRETSERILLHSYVHAAVSPLAKAYAIAASYPYNINTPAILDAVVKRVAEL